MRRGAAGGARPLIADTGSETRFEAVIAQEPQYILGDAGRRVADKADPVCTQIGHAADGIVYRAVRGEEYRVDGEVAPRRIGGPIGVKGDASAAAIGFDIAA